MDIKKRNVSKQIKRSVTRKENFSKLENQKIYTRQIVRFRVKIDFNNIGKNVRELLIDYAKKNIIGKCHKEGYISKEHIEVIEYTCPYLKGTEMFMDVQYEFDIFHPHIDLELYCKVQNITKIGIKAVLSEKLKENPVVVFASRIHNDHIFSAEDDIQDIDEDTSSGYKVNDIIKVRVLGYRFEINDPHVSLLTKIIVDAPKVIMN